MVYKMFSLYFNISNKALYKICIKYSVLFGLRLESDYALKIEIEDWNLTKKNKEILAPFISIGRISIFQSLISIFNLILINDSFKLI